MAPFSRLAETGPTFPVVPKMCDFSCAVAPIKTDMASPAPNRPDTFTRRRVRRGGIRPLVAAVATIVTALVAAAAESPGLPPPVRTKHRTFTIPFRLPASKDPDADAATQRVVLNVSKDLGASWSAAGETAPAAGSFSYTADVDGEYWFRLRAIDRKGRSRGGEGPDIRVIVDAAGPRLAARVWKGADGEIVCRYAAADDSLRLDSLVLEYRGPEDRGWKSVAADAVLAREAPAHLVGESIWWAGEKIEKLAVRIAVADASGNRTERTYSLQQADPAVDQAALAREIGVPALPEQSVESVIADAAPPAESLVEANSRPTEAGAWPAEAAPWPPTAPRPTSPTPPTEPEPRAPAAAGLLPRTAEAEARRSQTRTVSVGDPLSAAGISRSSGQGQQLEYRGRPLQLSRSRRFSWDYEIPTLRRTAGPLRAELWTTRDAGLTWQKAAVDADGRSPIEVALAEPGFYGVRLELVADTPDAASGPRSGAEPDAWVGIDEEPPQVELATVDRDEAVSEDVLIIRYAVRDPLLAANATRLLYSPNADGPWATIAADAANEGAYRWQPGPNVPARVFVRVEASDAAGNKGFAVAADAISVAPTRFGGRLGGLRVLPAP